ncbi:MAG: DUF3562 domain-containing protein [Sulfuricaulis sp.]
MVRNALYGDDKEYVMHLGAIHSLALTSGLPDGEVEKIYERELEKLKKTARVRNYLLVLTHRAVKDNLRHHS